MSTPSTPSRNWAYCMNVPPWEALPPLENVLVLLNRVWLHHLQLKSSRGLQAIILLSKQRGDAKRMNGAQPTNYAMFQRGFLLPEDIQRWGMNGTPDDSQFVSCIIRGQVNSMYLIYGWAHPKVDNERDINAYFHLCSDLSTSPLPTP